MRKWYELGLFLFFLMGAVCYGTGNGIIPQDEQKIELAKQGKLDQVKASFWGYDPEDATDSLQAAIRSGVKRLVIDRQSGPWILCPIELVSNIEIVLEEGVEILAKKGEFKDVYQSQMFLLYRLENVTIRGEGKGATIRMRKADYQDPKQYKKSEYRHCILLHATNNIRIENLTLADSGGDGICMGGLTEREFLNLKISPQSQLIQNRNVVLRNILCDNNHRQGISIGSAVNLLVDNCTLRNTKGTLPEAGIDFEPDSPFQHLQNCVVRNCLIENNAGAGLDFSLHNLYPVTADLSVRIEKCLIRNNKKAAIKNYSRFNLEKPLHGRIVIKDSILESNGNVFEMINKSAQDYQIVLENTRFKWRLNQPQRDYVDSPITIRSGGTPSGNLVFDHCTLELPGNAVPIRFNDYSMDGKGLENFEGLLTVKRNGRTSRFSLEEWGQRYHSADLRELPGIVDPLKLDLVPLNPNKKEAIRLPIFKSFPSGEAIRYITSAKKGEHIRFTVEQYPLGRFSVEARSLTITAPSGKKTAYTIEQKTTIDHVVEETGVYSLANQLKPPHFIAITDANCPILGLTSGWYLTRISTGTYYFHVPEGTKEFALKVLRYSYCPVRCTLKDPSGKIMWIEKKVQKSTTWFTDQNEPPIPGVWSLVVEQPAPHKIDDLGLKLYGIPSLFSPNPTMLLVPAK